MGRVFLGFIFVFSIHAVAGPLEFCISILERLHLKMNPDSQIVNFNKDTFYWRFPSDHLPVIGTVKLEESQEVFPALTWNVLNNNYMGYIVDPKNSQGLKVSEITETKDRGQRLMDIFTELIEDTRPSVVGLQEVDGPFLERLKRWGEQNNYGVIAVENPDTGRSTTIIDYGVILFDQLQMTVDSPPSMTATFFQSSRGPTKYIQHIHLRSRKGVAFEFINMHVYPVDPDTLSAFLSEPVSQPTLALGDFNMTHFLLDQKLEQTIYKRMQKQRSIEYTHINTKKDLEDYDHLIVAGPITVTSDLSLNKLARKHFRIENR